MSFMGPFCEQTPKQNRRSCLGTAPFGLTNNFSLQIREQRGQPDRKGDWSDATMQLIMLTSTSTVGFALFFKFLISHPQSPLETREVCGRRRLLVCPQLPRPE